MVRPAILAQPQSVTYSLARPIFSARRGGSNLETDRFITDIFPILTIVAFLGSPIGGRVGERLAKSASNSLAAHIPPVST